MAERKIGESTEKRAGNRGKGRPKGSKNKTTSKAKDAIAMAADGLGGVDRLIVWAKEDPANERVFWSQMFTKLLPHQVEGSEDDGSIGIVFKTIIEK